MSPLSAISSLYENVGLHTAGKSPVEHIALSITVVIEVADKIKGKLIDEMSLEYA